MCVFCTSDLLQVNAQVVSGISVILCLALGEVARAAHGTAELWRVRTFSPQRYTPPAVKVVPVATS